MTKLRKNTSLKALATYTHKKAKSQYQLYERFYKYWKSGQGNAMAKTNADSEFSKYIDLAEIAVHLYRLSGVDIPEDLQFLSNR